MTDPEAATERVRVTLDYRWRSPRGWLGAALSMWLLAMVLWVALQHLL